MDCNDANSITNLRKKSQELLNHLENNSKLIESELQRLKLQSSSRTLASNHHECKSVNHGISEAWKIRNDSSEVCNLLCPDLDQSLNQKPQDQGDMTVGGRILITSKRPVELQSPRKPIKGCYCSCDQKKIQFRSSRTVYKPTWPCEYCISNFDIQLPEAVESQREIPSVISSDTLKKVQKINYTPRSEFLRRVQQKASKNDDICRSCSEPIIKSIPHVRIQDPDNVIETDPEGGRVRYRISQRLKPNEEERRTPEIETIFSAQSLLRPTSSSRTVSKKTVSSKSVGETVVREKLSLVTSRNKPISRTLTQKSCQTDCCPVNVKSKTSKRRKKTGQETCLQCHRCPDRCPSRFLTPVSRDKEHEEVLKLRKFREKNYFDTHGSKHTLLLNQDPSESLQQYELNDRLFPEPVGTIRRGDLVVSMPVCATKQFKRVHYFPRFIVKQDERAEALKKDRIKHERCPLTGHAIDVRALKAPLPANSLALKFQKRNA